MVVVNARNSVEKPQKIFAGIATAMKELPVFCGKMP
jgi:hypothetical protein